MVEKSVQNWRARILIAGVLCYALLLLVAPVMAIIIRLFQDGVEPVLKAFSHPDIRQTLSLTFAIALASTAINTVLGVGVSWVLVRHRFPGRGLFNALVDLPFVVSPVIVGFVIIVLFGRVGWFPVKIAFTPLAMLLVTVFVSLPFVIREVMPILASLTAEEEEAAVTLGASRFTIFRRVIIPAIRHGVVYGLVLTMARSLGEFGAAAVAGGGIQGVTETATIYIFRSIHDRNNTGAYTMALILGLISIAVLLIMNTLRAVNKEYDHVDSIE